MSATAERAELAPAAELVDRVPPAADPDANATKRGSAIRLASLARLQPHVLERLVCHESEAALLLAAACGVWRR